MKRRGMLQATAGVACSGILPSTDAVGQRRKLAPAIAGAPVAAWPAPDGDIYINRHCHAWSCKPSRLLRRPDFPS